MTLKIAVHEYITWRESRNPGCCPPALYRLGRAMLNAITSDLYHLPNIELIQTSELPLEEAALLDHLATLNLDGLFVIAPEFDDILLNLAKVAISKNIPWIGSTPQAIQLTGDKLALAHHWQSHQLATPPTALLHKDRSYPGNSLIVKPRHGAGSIATAMIRSMEDWHTILPKLQNDWPGELIIQPWIEGVPVSCSLLVGPSAMQAFPPTYQILDTDFVYQGGEIIADRLQRDAVISAAMAGAAVVPGLHGYVGVDLVIGDEIIWLIELNPRLSTSYVGLRRVIDGPIGEALILTGLGREGPKWQWSGELLEFRVTG